MVLEIISAPIVQKETGFRARALKLWGLHTVERRAGIFLRGFMGLRGLTRCSVRCCELRVLQVQ